MVYGQLHQLIEQTKWDEIIQFLQEDSSLQSDTKEIYKSDLPLHMACQKKAPDDVVLEIIRHNFNALFHVGRGGNLPLHVAVSRDMCSDVIESMIRANPSALEFKNELKVTPKAFNLSDVYAKQAINRQVKKCLIGTIFHRSSCNNFIKMHSIFHFNLFADPRVVGTN
mmetsp:Transcript_9206/g.13051  ORF Transcript_9206/g.13051 Transcript_9206/m.13051 type:complete len:168 (-) Transcript_9206:634-1137(-)